MWKKIQALETRNTKNTAYLGELTLLMWRITFFFVRIYLATINNQCLFDFFMEYHGSCANPPIPPKFCFLTIFCCVTHYLGLFKRNKQLYDLLSSAAACHV